MSRYGTSYGEIIVPVEYILRNNIQEQGLLCYGRSVIVALSGGADSVALLAALCRLGYRCVAAHCNFHLRGDESNRDEAHAIKVACQFGVECRVTHFDVQTYEREHGVSTEMACRELRYEWFERLRQECDAQAIAVAHHRDDDIETMFLNLLRGSGISGAAGMKWKNGYVVRPMLNVSRVEVEDYVNRCGLEYVTDSTNKENEFKRNRLRNEVLPVLNDCFPGASEMLSKSLSFLKEGRKIYDEVVTMSMSKYKKGDVIKLSAIVDEFVAPSTLLFEMLNPLGFNYSQVESMVGLVGSSGRRFYSRDWEAVVNRDELQLVKKNDYKEAAEYVICIAIDGEVKYYVKHEKEETEVNTLPIELQVELVEGSSVKPKAHQSEMFLDAEVLEKSGRFVLRHWRDGDRIAPFGMRGTKKISDLFSDAKLSLSEKEKVWLLEYEGDILWVVGMRASRHFSIKDDTKRILWIKNLQSGL